MEIIQTIKQVFLPIRAFFSQVWDREPSPPPIDPESQSSEIQPPPSPIIDPDTLQSPQEEPQPRPFNVEIQLQAQPSQQLPPSPSSTNTQVLVNSMVIVKHGLEWPNIVMAFCFAAALQIALQCEQITHSKLHLSFYLRSFAVLLTFAFLFVSHFIHSKFPVVSKAFEKVAILLVVTAFFFTIACPLTLTFKYATWIVYAISVLTILICNYCF